MHISNKHWMAIQYHTKHPNVMHRLEMHMHSNYLFPSKVSAIVLHIRISIFQSFKEGKKQIVHHARAKMKQLFIECFFMCSDVGTLLFVHCSSSFILPMNRHHVTHGFARRNQCTFKAHMCGELIVRHFIRVFGIFNSPSSFCIVAYLLSCYSIMFRFARQVNEK